MIETSDAWRQAHEQTLVPETFVEIKCNMVDSETRDLAEVTGTNEVIFSNADDIVANVDIPECAHYATLEENLWILDGSRVLVDETATEYDTPGYVSGGADDEVASVTITFPEKRTNTVPGLTITWSSQYGEYATDAKVVTYKNGSIVAEMYIEGNTSNVTFVERGITNYDTVVITVTGWSTPNHRVRIDQVVFGCVVTFDKNDLISYKHEQSGCVFSGELPKNSVAFTVSDVDGRWNHLNPSGLGKYLTERQEIVVRYGTQIDSSTVEWIPGGKFYLSEWSAPSNGLEASFVARDAFEFALNVPYADSTYDDLYLTANAALAKCEFPSDYEMDINGALSNYYPMRMEGALNHTAAEIVQMCANATGCVMWHDRKGVFHLDKMDLTKNGYIIGKNVFYSYPEAILSKPLKKLTVCWYETEDDLSDPYTYTSGNSSVADGECQSVDNILISSENQAYEILTWIRGILSKRLTVSGEFRANPVLDLYDIVTVESKYGNIVNVALTNITYTYSGAFRGTFEGRVVA